MLCCRTSTRGITQNAGKFLLANAAHCTNNLDHRDGLGSSLSLNPFPASVLCTNSAIVSVNAVMWHQSQPSSLSSTSLAFTPSALPIASVTRQVPLLSVVRSSCVCGGFLRRGKDRVRCSLSGFSTSSTNCKHKARSACMTRTPPLSLSRTLPA